MSNQGLTFHDPLADILVQGPGRIGHTVNELPKEGVIDAN